MRSASSAADIESKPVTSYQKDCWRPRVRMCDQIVGKALQSDNSCGSAGVSLRVVGFEPGL